MKKKKLVVLLKDLFVGQYWHEFWVFHIQKYSSFKREYCDGRLVDYPTPILSDSAKEIAYSVDRANGVRKKNLP